MVVLKATILATILGAVSALSPIEVKGNAFWKDGERFYIRGVDYQPGGSSATSVSDPLADTAACKRDIQYFKELGVNTVRVYSVDPSKNHDECMKELEKNDIYLILDVNNPSNSINRAQAECSYNAFYLKNVFDVIDAFAGYDNTLGYFAANEVINDEKTTGAAKFVKATVRDMKKYIAARNYRKIPVGYSAADIATNRKDQIQYFSCGNDPDARVDFWGHNDYSWCAESDMQKSGYSTLIDEFKNLPLPIFFSEFGCNSVKDRPFTEIQAIYSDKMSSVLSGGLVYEYSQEANNYGLVSVSGSTVTPLGSYANLKKQYAAAKNPAGDGGYSESYPTPSCPTTSSTWLSDANLPETPAGAQKMIEEGAGAVVAISELGDTSFKCKADYNYPTGSSNVFKGTTSSNITTFNNSTILSSGYNNTLTNNTNSTSNITATPSINNNTVAIPTQDDTTLAPYATTLLSSSLTAASEHVSSASPGDQYKAASASSSSVHTVKSAAGAHKVLPAGLAFVGLLSLL